MTRASPHSFLSTWLRIAVAFVWFGVTATLLLVVLVLLLPSRKARLYAGGVFARSVCPGVLAILGIRLDVEHRERIEQLAPAVFVINHASSIDTFASMSLWPRLGVGIGKKEVIWLPFFGPAYVLSGHLRIDRSDRRAAIAAIDDLVTTIAALRLSPWIAPEGTRSRDGALGRFKKGFAHIAIAGRLPIVPVVFHNARELWPTPGFSIRPGVVRVSVLDPIATTEWSLDTLDEHVASVRQAFIDAL